MARAPYTACLLAAKHQMIMVSAQHVWLPGHRDGACWQPNIRCSTVSAQHSMWWSNYSLVMVGAGRLPWWAQA